MNCSKKRWHDEKKYISESSDWTFDLINRYDHEISQIAADFRLDTYPNQIEVISAEQMIDAYSSVGMPIGYNHWSFGKQFIDVEQKYRRGQMGLAYEIVINSNPCISYLMEENTMTMQALVIAHAAYGHNSFFKNNYLFKTWSNADSIIDYMVFARKYINQCEQRYGDERVELLLDSCHALMNYGVDKYKRPGKLSTYKELEKQQERERYVQSQVNDLWRTLPQKSKPDKTRSDSKLFPVEPQENILYFIEKNAPLLEPWEREIVRIVRKIAQYFHPQRQTQVMNEGWATFWHYTILNKLHEKALVTDSFIMEFLQSHTNVVYQPAFNSPYYSGINPYALGFGMMTDIRRICEHPTNEDRQWFPDIAGQDWIKVLDYAMRNFRDESFIAQFLSPKLIRDMRLFTVLDDDNKHKLQISSIHDDQGYRAVRHALSAQYNPGNHEPNIQVYSVDQFGDRSLTLRHFQYNRVPLGKSTHAVMKHISRLWGFTTRIETCDSEGRTELVDECVIEQ